LLKGRDRADILKYPHSSILLHTVESHYKVLPGDAAISML